ncbi:unnamed protein product [Rhizopus microsporus]|uniref:Uncharacterized protein n=1 Tax=Rhizopus microsporus TaxID=58291 RepID=A0A1X0RNI6_RHIZD|nr:hypothetical protein BCV71DRAFT_268172 [Rhizopus microsporus]
MSDSADYFRDILIELDDLYLEILSLTTVKWLDSEQTPEEELVCVEMKGRRQYVKVCTGEIPKTITNEEGAALWEYFPDRWEILFSQVLKLDGTLFIFTEVDSKEHERMQTTSLEEYYYLCGYNHATRRRIEHQGCHLGEFKYISE